MLIPDQIYLIIMSIFIIRAHLFVSRKQMLSNFANYERRGGTLKLRENILFKREDSKPQGRFLKIVMIQPQTLVQTYFVQTYVA